jgi:hypothetical protein
MGQAERVTVVTEDAEHDALTAAEYHDIYEELRRFDSATGKYGVSLEAFGAAIQSRFSKAAWSKYQRGELALNRAMRNELRVAVGLAILPPTVVEAIAAADPNAKVVQVGDDCPQLIVMMSPHATKATFNSFINHVKDSHTPRRRRFRIAIDGGLFDRLNQRRQALGLTWTEMLGQLEE